MLSAMRVAARDEVREAWTPWWKPEAFPALPGSERELGQAQYLGGGDTPSFAGCTMVSPEHWFCGSSHGKGHLTVAARCLSGRRLRLSGVRSGLRPQRLEFGEADWNSGLSDFGSPYNTHSCPLISKSYFKIYSLLFSPLNPSRRWH